MRIAPAHKVVHPTATPHLENRVRRARLLQEQKRDGSHARPSKVERTPGERSQSGTRKAASHTRDGRANSAAPPVNRPIISTTKVRSISPQKKAVSVKLPPKAAPRRVNSSQSESPYAPSNQPSRTKEIQIKRMAEKTTEQLVEEVRRLQAENEKLKKFESRSAESQKSPHERDFSTWSRKDLLLLIDELENKEVRKPVQAVVKKLREMSVDTSLIDELEDARAQIVQLSRENGMLRDQLTTTQETSSSTASSGHSVDDDVSVKKVSVMNQKTSPSRVIAAAVQRQPTVDEKESTTRTSTPRRPAIVPRLDMTRSSSSDYPDIEINGVPHQFDDNDEGQGSLKNEMIEENPNGEREEEFVETDPAKMVRVDYDIIACDIVHAARAHLVRRRWIERWKSDRSDRERMIVERAQEAVEAFQQGNHHHHPS